MSLKKLREKPESKQETFWEKRKQANEVKQKQEFQMQVDKPAPDVDSDEDQMEDDSKDQNKKWHDPDDYGESWWANSLDEEGEWSASHEEGKNNTKQKSSAEYHNMSENEERQPEEELSDGRTSSAGRSSARQKEEEQIEQMTKLLKQSEERNSEMKEEIKKSDEWRATIQKTADLHHAMLASVTQEIQTQRASMKNFEATVMTAIGGLQAAVDALVKKGAAEAGNIDTETTAKVRRIGD